MAQQELKRREFKCILCLKINPRENLLARKLVGAKICTLKLVVLIFVPSVEHEKSHCDCIVMNIGQKQKEINWKCE